jgi:hypothetical protein
MVDERGEVSVPIAESAPFGTEAAKEAVLSA